jgi:hypothetical protein
MNEAGFVQIVEFVYYTHVAGGVLSLPNCRFGCAEAQHPHTQTIKALVLTF